MEKLLEHSIGPGLYEGSVHKVGAVGDGAGGICGGFPFVKKWMAVSMASTSDASQRQAQGLKR